MKLIVFFSAVSLFAADQATIDKGKAEERRACAGCHSLRLGHSQRLSRGTWEKELDKMGRWGAGIKDRAALMEYLVANFGDDKPVPNPDKSADGTK
jgi:mono/diheme cytochrome c family protein